MKFRFLNIVSDLLAEIMNYLIIVSFWAVGNALGDIDDNGLLIAAGIIVPFFLYFVRLKIQSFFPFTLIHIAIPVIGIYLCPDVAHKIIIGIVLVALSTISYVVSMKCEDQGAPCIHPVVAGVVFFATIMLLGMLNTERLIYIPKLALLFAALYLPYFYIERFTWFDYINSKTISNIPTMDSLKIGGPIVGGLSLFYAIAALAGLNESLIEGMSGGLRRVIRAIMIAFLGQRYETGSYSYEVGGIMGSNDGPEMTFGEYSEPSKLALFLEKAGIYIAVVCIVLLLLIALYLGIKALINKIRGKKVIRRVKVLQDAVETRESIDRKERRKPLEALIQEGSYSNRIRRMYRKIVRKHPELTDKPELFTVRRFAELFKDKNFREEAENFAVYYEKARYSPEDVTKEDYLCARRCTSLLL